jgi:chromosome segregation ATPase
LGSNAYLASRIHAVDESAATDRVLLEQQVSRMEERLAAREGSHARTVAGLRAELEKTQQVASTQAREEARRQTGSTAKFVADRQREQQEMFLGEIGAVRTAADENRQGIDTVRAQVDGVLGTVDETRKDLSETEDVLLRTQDDLSSVAGRVDEQGLTLSELQRRGERETTPFVLSESKSRSKIGDLQVRLRDANPSKNRYTVEILADDQLILRKDRSVNEPVELYVTGSERPYEIVVTKVEKGRVRGFLSRPAWRQMARN